MLFTEWNWDDALRIEREEGREEGIEKGREEGFTVGKSEAVRSLLGLLPDDVLAERVGVPLSTIVQMRREQN